MNKLFRQFLALAVMLSVVLNPAFAAVLCGLDCEKAMDAAASPTMVMSEMAAETPPCHEQMVASVDDADQFDVHQLSDDMSPDGQTLSGSSDNSGVESGASDMNSMSCDCPDHCSVISMAVTSDQSELVALPNVAGEISGSVQSILTARSANPFRPPIA